MKAFLASLHHAVWTRKSVDIAGSYFTPDELEEPLRMLETSADLLDALHRALPFIEDAESDPVYKPGAVKQVRMQILATIDKATSNDKERTAS